MGRGVKIILSLSISIMFPVLVGLFVFLIIPEAKIAYPSSPPYSDSYSCSANYYSRTSYESVEVCRAKADAEYRAKKSQYDLDLKNYEKTKNSSTVNRVIVALIASIIGFLIAISSGSFSAVAVGLTGGSTIILLVVSNAIGAITDSVNPIVVGLYILCFIILMVLLFRIDSVFPAPVVETNSDIALPKPNIMPQESVNTDATQQINSEPQPPVTNPPTDSEEKK